MKQFQLPKSCAKPQEVTGSWRLQCSSLCGALAFVLFSWPGIADAQSIRVTSFSLGAKNGSPVTSESLQDATATLQKLNPDVVLLKDVADWQTCNRLAESLKPAAFNVVVCSSFRGVDSAKLPQVAILSRHKAYISWAQNWRSENGEPNPNGFVFAAIQIGQRRLGFFSLQAGPKSMASQWLRGIDGVKSWVNNRLEGFVAAGPLNQPTVDRESLQTLEDAGFSNPFLSQKEPSNANATLFTSVSFPPGIVIDHWPATCDFTIEVPSAGSVATAVRGHLLPPEPPAAAVTPANIVAAAPLKDTNQSIWQTYSRWLVSGAGIFVLGLAVRQVSQARKRFRKHQSPGLLPLHAGERLALAQSHPALMAPASSTGSSSAAVPATLVGGTVVNAAPHDLNSEEDWKRRALIAEQQAREATELVRRGLLPQVSEWLKGKMFRKLIGDRARITEMQEEATLKTLHVDERLARVEKQIQEQHRAYQVRIDALTRELHAARSENCDLIRAQITQVKAEMEANRARLLAEAGGNFPA